MRRETTRREVVSGQVCVRLSTGISITQEETMFRNAQGVQLTPLAAWQLLQFLYDHRREIYDATHLGQAAAPAWLGGERQAAAVGPMGAAYDADFWEYEDDH